MLALYSVLNWNEAPAFGRRKTLLATLERLHQLHPGPACIVETGTIRDDRSGACAGDGWSTIAWGWYASQTGGKVYTIDIAPQAIETCKRLTVGYAAHLDYVCADSLKFLSQWNTADQGAIHLLYLDSFDYHDQEKSEAHHLAEVKAALPALAPACLVLFDDTRPSGPAAEDGVLPLAGKGARAIPFLLEQGFTLE
ncbi:MAG TPA: class I SAM-dependent methyltransferase [Chthonomonadaceae bacterium]|nr:class I SAM-dependent methyltransferase [Chthonomonadaceae bacterium]